jgi:hypothetical protein
MNDIMKGSKRGASDGHASKADGENIDISEPGSLRRWSRELRVDERTLKAAVLKAGPSVSAVREFLRTSQSDS